MKYQLKVTLSLAAVALLVGLCAALWFSLMEKRWTWELKDRDNAVQHDMEAAARLLRQRGHAVEVRDTMGGLHPRDLKDGTLVLTNAAAVMSSTMAADLLAWAGRGNTIVVRPRLMNRKEEAAHAAFLRRAAGSADDKAARAGDDEPAGDGEVASGDDGTAVVVARAEETDPLGTHFGLRAYYLDDEDKDDYDEEHEGHDHGPRKGDSGGKASVGKPEPAPPFAVTLPGYPYPLETRPVRIRLVNSGGSDLTYWGDEHGESVRGYPTGAGQVVMVAYNHFDDDSLGMRDNAELLVALARLTDGKGKARAVTIVLDADIPAWYEAIWNHYKFAVISLGCLLLLALWSAVRRFGPMLPQPLNERRSLMEHIDASGAWLWKAAGGRQQLLDAARSDTLGVLERRAPALARMAPDRMAAALAAAAGLEASHVIEALQREAYPQIPLFTRQIRTLQTLRNHYER